MTLILAISTLDGIVMAADSRVGIQSPRSKEQNRCIGYHDCGQKLFEFKRIFAGISWAGSIDSRIHRMIEDFTQKYSASDFQLDQVQKTIHDSVGAALREAQISSIIAGFDSSGPSICYRGHRSDVFYPLKKTYGFQCNYKEVQENAQDDRFKIMSLSSAVAYTYEFIAEYSSQNDYWKGIGGEIDILIIQPQTKKWHQKEPFVTATAGTQRTNEGYPDVLPKYYLYEGYSKEDLLDALRNAG